MKIRLLLLVLGATLLLAAGCSGQPVQSSGTRAQVLYRVKPGDTLYSIAWRYALDVKDLTAWNRLQSPNKLYVGQGLYLRPPPGYVKTIVVYRPPPATNSVPPSNRSSPTATPGKQASIPPAPTLKPGAAVAPKLGASEPAQPEPLHWRWPTVGQVVRSDARSTPGRAGIDIQAPVGQAVVAAESGKVVYSGSGLKGYGEMVIIKHAGNYLSAYAHNRRRFVSEGAHVQRGQKIAEVGRSEAGKPLLHFQIRRNGKPVDPLGLLPRQAANHTQNTRKFQSQ